MATSAERQRAHRARLAELGLVPISGVAPRASVAQLQMLMDALRINPDLEIVTLRDTKTGKFVAIDKVLANR